MKKTLLLIAGWLSLATALLGIVLPLLPTTPFLLLSALCFSRSSTRWHQWICNHPRFGPPIQQWQQHRTVNRSTKLKALSLLVASFSVSLLLAPLSHLGQDLLMILALVLMGFISRLPEQDLSHGLDATGQLIGITSNREDA